MGPLDAYTEGGAKSPFGSVWPVPQGSMWPAVCWLERNLRGSVRECRVSRLSRIAAEPLQMRPSLNVLALPSVHGVCTGNGVAVATEKLDLRIQQGCGFHPVLVCTASDLKSPSLRPWRVREIENAVMSSYLLQLARLGSVVCN